MRRLILIKHSKPQIVPGVTASHWLLSEQGRVLCVDLAQRLSAFDLKVLITSEEPKAEETGKRAAEILKIPHTTMPNLHEHDRSNITTFESQDRFESQVRSFFEKPNELVYGKETASAALHRFRRAVDAAIQAVPAGDVAIVAHGTVITLFVASVARVDPFEFWKRLDLPSYVVLTVPEFDLVEVVESLKQG